MKLAIRSVRAIERNGESTEWEIPSEIVVDGTIAPKVFWKYINRIRKAEDRIIGVFQFLPASDADRKMYDYFFSLMRTKTFFSFIEMVRNMTIKELYVLPLPNDSPFPLALVALSSGTEGN